MDKDYHKVLTALTVRVEYFKKGLNKAVEGLGKHYRLLNHHWVMLSTYKAFYDFRARQDEIRCANDPPKFVDEIAVEYRVTNSF